MKNNIKIIIFLVFSIFFILFTPAFAEVGNVLYVLGKVQKKDLSGNVMRVRKNDALDSGDTLITSKNGQVMIVMLDENKITIRPSTVFFIIDYSYKNDSKKDKSYYKLVKGGLRSVTGIMGDKNKKSFKLQTNIATMGIRGTDFDLAYCEENCTDNKGLYVKVINGSVTLANDRGSKDIDAGDIGHVSGFNESPGLAEELPRNMRIGKGDSNSGLREDLDSYPTHEEEMAAIALDGNASQATFQELLESELPKRDILKGAVSIGMDATDVVETLLKISPDADEIIEQSIDAFPEKAEDFTTMGVVLGDISDETIKKIQAKKGVDAKAVKSGKSLGDLIAPRKYGKKEKNDANKVGKKPPKSADRPRIDPELLPGKGTGGGKPASAS